MAVDRLEIVGQESSGSGGGSEQRAVCRDCVGVGMTVEKDLEGLRVEAKVATTLQVGVSGVLWLAAMSG